jgi:very-short-patch-repair endonuclease
VITHVQLLDFGFTVDAIRHRLVRGRLHRVFRSVYAVGRPELTRKGVWMAAVLSCGPTAVLSHCSSAALWGFRPDRCGAPEVLVPHRFRHRRPGIQVHRSRTMRRDHVTVHDGIPVTTPIRTLVDLAPRLDRRQLERSINEADRLGLTDPERLRRALEHEDGRQPGVAILRRTLDRRTFTKTRSDLERDFLPLARAAGLPKPLTQQIVNGFEVDFYWPELKLVVESDGLRYHRTPAEQARDRLRDQAHAAAGLTPLRFTDEQIEYEQKYVMQTLSAVARRLAA